MVNDEGTTTLKNNTDNNAREEDGLDWAVPIALRKGIRSCVKYPMS